MAGPTDATAAERARFRREVPVPWGAPCPRCLEPMLPGQPLDVGHVWDVVDHGPGPMRWEHRACNRRAGDRRRGRRPPPAPRVNSRSW